MNANNILEIHNLKIYFKPSPLSKSQDVYKAVDGVSLSIEKGKILALVGESGCGKSMTALSIVQLHPQESSFIPEGSIYFKNQNLVTLNKKELHKIRGKQVGVIFQEPMKSLNPTLTIGFQIIEAIALHNDLDKNDLFHRAIELLDLVKIKNPHQVFKNYPHQLSGGMRQRVIIAISIASDPDLLIADEPTTALDVTIQKEILELLKEIQVKKQMSILFITHDLVIASQFADNIAIMYAGQIVEQSSCSSFFKKALHPYSIKLLQSAPTKKYKPYYLNAIDGIVPLSNQYTALGCRFAPRCFSAKEICNKQTPILKTVSTEQSVSCLLYDDNNQGTLLEEQHLLLEKPKKNISEEVYLKINNLKVYYPVKRSLFQKKEYIKAVDDVSFSVYKGEIFALVGESGCGKTTLGKAILNLIPHYSGEVMANGRNIYDTQKDTIRKIRKENQIIFQDPFSSLNPRMSVYNIIAEGIVNNNHRISKIDLLKKIEMVLELVSLPKNSQYRYPHEFSGGQRQRISIARALAVEPKFLVCDEATSALDISIQAQILNLLTELKYKMDLTYIFITHNLHIVQYFADRVAIMNSGKIIESGSVESIFTNPKEQYTKQLLTSAGIL